MKKKRIDLVYLAKPSYGGYVSYTAHLYHRLKKNYRVRLFKIRKRREKSTRDFGYGVRYRNISIDDVGLLHNPLVTAVDRHYADQLDAFIYQSKKDRYGAMIPAMLTIHDPSELNAVIVNNAKTFRVLTIRLAVQEFLKREHNLDSEFIYHPFFRFKMEEPKKRKRGAVSLSRIDWDKNTHVIMEANEKLKRRDRCEIWGVHNRAYVKRKMDWDKFFEVYKGRFGKSFGETEKLLRDRRYLVDMSAIKNDGMGTQYTFLEAIHCGCVLVLNREWFSLGVENKGLVPDHNCLVADDAKDIADILSNKYPCNREELVKNAKKLLKRHIWDKLPYKVY